MQYDEPISETIAKKWQQHSADILQAISRSLVRVGVFSCKNVATESSTSLNANDVRQDFRTGFLITIENTTHICVAAHSMQGAAFDIPNGRRVFKIVAEAGFHSTSTIQIKSTRPQYAIAINDEFNHDIGLIRLAGC